MSVLVIHGTTVGGEEVLATDELCTFWPPGSGPGTDAFARFGIEWRYGTLMRGPFRVCIGTTRPYENHFDLILEGDSPTTARVGLRPWKRDQSGPDPDAEVLRAGVMVKNRAALRYLALMMSPGGSAEVYLPDEERLVDNGPGSELDTFIAELDAARTDGASYDARAGFHGRQISIKCLPLRVPLQ